MFSMQTVIIGLIAIAGAFSSGMYTMNQFAKADRLELVELQKVAQEEALKRAEESFKRQRELDTQSYTQLEIVAQRANADLETAKSELDEYVEIARTAAMVNNQRKLGAPEEIRHCPDPLVSPVAVGVVGLLNKARVGDSEPEDGVPDTTGSPPAALREPSAVTYAAEVEYHIGCGNAYRKLKARHDGLVDWLEQRQKLSEEVR